MRTAAFVFALAAISVSRAPPAPAGEAEQRAELERLRRILPRSEPWEAWLAKTGELPPEFAALPSIPDLPDPLVFDEGGKSVPVRTPADWERKRATVLADFTRLVFGTVPPPPGNVRVSSEGATPAGSRQVVLAFGPEEKARLTLEVLFPAGGGPFPVFLTQETHRGWALVAQARGWIGCTYAGCDSHDDTEAWRSIWPDHDWTRLTRRAWAASRAIDYLITLPAVDAGRIALTGHSRNGKTSLIAAALDPRIAAVISSSSGAGGASPYRLYSEAQLGEGIELITRNFPEWLHPRLRFFAGREDRLPIDAHELVALAAPRSCLIATALNDSVESAWAAQEVMRAVRPVWDLLGAPGKVALSLRHGSHGTRAMTIEGYLDWLDRQFGRGGAPVPDRLLYPTFESWRAATGERVDPRAFPAHGIDDLLEAEGRRIDSPEAWHARRGEIEVRLRALLGEEPARAAGPAGDYGAEEPFRAMLLDRGATPRGVVKKSLNFGGYIAGDLDLPEGAKPGDRLVGVVWLHPICPSNGYVGAYRRGDPIHIALVRAGFAVLAYDQVGFGSRIEEAERFYERFPRWSLLGKMVRDARDAVAVLRDTPGVDPERVFPLGYGLGGTVALLAAALEERAAGAVCVSGAIPFRADPRGSGGVRRWSSGLALLPRLGFFEGEEDRMPFELHEAMALIAPRPLLVVTPAIGHEAAIPGMKTALERVAAVYRLLGADGGPASLFPDDYDRYGPELQGEVNRRLKEMVGR